MKTTDKILANVVLVILLASCYFLLPIALIAAFTFQWLVSSYIYLTGLVRSGYHGMTSTFLHLVIVPTVLIVMTAIYWIKSRQIDVTSLLSPGKDIAKLREEWEPTVNCGLLVIHRFLPGQVFVHVETVWKWIKYHIDTGTAQETGTTTRIQRAAEEPSVEEVDIIEIPARIRTQEEQRLHRCIENLEALEAEGLSETMTTEEAILLVMTRAAAANGKGVVCYSLSEKHGPHGRDHRPEIHRHQILRPHNMYYRLHTSCGNIFRPDEPDCAICYSPLVYGEPMVTHDTCRRTFHEVCYMESLLRRRECPFDREWFLHRIPAHTEPAPIINAAPNGDAVEQPVANPPAPIQLRGTWPELVRQPQPQAQTQPQAEPQQPQFQPPPPQVQLPQPQAQPGRPQARPARIRRGRLPAVGRNRLAAQGPIGQRDRPTPVRAHAQRPGNHQVQNNGPQNDGRAPKNGRQPNIRRVRNEPRRAWR